jgi:hypothetical protein
MKYILFILLLISFRSFAQTVTVPMLNQKLDSLSSSMDSTVFKKAVATNATYIVLDTLSLPQNSFGFFTIYYCSFDTTAKDLGSGMEEIFISRIGTSYSNPFINTIAPYQTTGLPTHQVIFSVIPLGGVIVVRVDGFNATDPIRWHVIRQAKISTL